MLRELAGGLRPRAAYRSVVCGFLIAVASAAVAQPTGDSPRNSTPAQQADSAGRQAKLDAAFIEMLSGATLEGSFTSTSPESDPTKLSREKYTLGEVKKIAGDVWLIPARIQYGEYDVTLPVTVPVQWAGDTPVVVVDNVGLPGFGVVSARVMFFDGHYAGYWKHGKKGGHLFGIITPAEKTPSEPVETPEASQSSRSDAPSGQQEQENSRKE